MSKQAVIRYLASEVRGLVGRAEQCEAEEKKAAEAGQYGLAIEMRETARRLWDAAEEMSNGICRIALGARERADKEVATA